MHGRRQLIPAPGIKGAGIECRPPGNLIGEKEHDGDTGTASRFRGPGLRPRRHQAGDE